MSQQITIPGPGDTLAERYSILEELGRGSYGVVFKAREQTSGALVAIKTLLPQSVLDREVIERFEREAQLVSRLDHPHIIGLHDYGQRENLFYMVMEFVEGRSFDELLKAEAPMPPERAAALLTQILLALDHAHERGIVHRDLKPANILLKPEPDGSESIKVLDFGIAKALHDENQDMKTLTQAGHVLGTPHYMSPEQIAGDEVDHRADLYAVGVILYELLVGEHPFEGTSSMAVMVAHLRDDPPPLPGALDRSVWGKVVREALRKQPAERIASAELFLALMRQPAEHDSFDTWDSGEVTTLFAPSSFVEEDEPSESYGAETLEMDPLLFAPAKSSSPGAPPGATAAWRRDPSIHPKHGAPQPDFGATPAPVPTFPNPSAIAAPAPDPSAVFPGAHDALATASSSASMGAGSRRRGRALPILIALALVALLGLLVYLLAWPQRRAAAPLPALDSPDVVAAPSSSTPPSNAAIKPPDVLTSPTPLEPLEPEPELKPPPPSLIEALLLAAERVDAAASEGDLMASSAASAASKPPPRRPRRSATITLKVVSEPPAANVRIEGRDVGKTPLTHTLDRSNNIVSVSVSLLGHAKATRVIKPNRDRVVKVSLKPELLEITP